MYQPPLFRESDTARLHALIDAHPFGTLIVPDANGALEIAHLPFLLDRNPTPLGRLRVHVAIANPIWKLAAARPAVAIFQGPDAYVSPTWYEKPNEQVPTWNYAVVHAHGQASIMQPADLRQFVSDLTAANEPPGDRSWHLDNLNPALSTRLLDQIVGLTIQIDRLEGKFKLSQNRSPADRARVKNALTARGSTELAKLMNHVP
jgi:transcriptional regulator